MTFACERTTPGIVPRKNPRLDELVDVDVDVDVVVDVDVDVNVDMDATVDVDLDGSSHARFRSRRVNVPDSAPTSTFTFTFTTTTTTTTTSMAQTVGLRTVSEPGAGDLRQSQVVSRGLLVSSRDRAKALEVVEEDLDHVANAVEGS